MKPTAHRWLWGSLVSISLLWLWLFGPALWDGQDPQSSMSEHDSAPRSPSAPAPAPLPVPAPQQPEETLPPDATLAPSTPHQGGIVIVMDDMGENLAAAQELLHLPFPVTLSIWPHSRHARQTAEMAHAAGREVFIHLPMQPLAARKDVGPQTLMQGDSAARIASVVQDARHRVPHAIGINNHMGSKLTTHNPTVSTLCAVLTPTELVILDSVTHPASLLYTAARKRALPALRRDIFLDHHQDRPSVLAQLEKARLLAHKRGVVVVIGHPHPVTVQALRQWGPPPDVTVLTVRQALSSHR